MTDNKDFLNNEDSYSTPLAQERAKRAKRRINRRKDPKNKAIRLTVSLLVVLLVFLIAFSIGSFISKLIFSAPEGTAPESQDNTSTFKLQNALNDMTEYNKKLEDDVTRLEKEKKEIAEERDYFEARAKKYEEKFGALEDLFPAETETTEEESQSPEAFATEPVPPDAPADQA